MMRSVPARIEAHLRACGAPFERLEHAHAHTSTEVAAARGTPLQIGGKSLIFKMGSGPATDFRLFVISGARRTDGRSIRRFLGVKRMRFATPDELHALTGLTPGCVPPFGRPIFEIPVYVDQSVVDNDAVAFSAGLHTVSLRMRTADYIRAAQPAAVFSFSRD